MYNDVNRKERYPLENMKSSLDRLFTYERVMLSLSTLTKELLDANNYRIMIEGSSRSRRKTD